MKLLLCLNCSDVRKLQMKWTYCMCKQSKGRYVDDLNAETKGKYLVPLGLHNIELVEAVYRRPKNGLGTNIYSMGNC